MTLIIAGKTFLCRCGGMAFARKHKTFTCQNCDQKWGFK